MKTIASVSIIAVSMFAAGSTLSFTHPTDMMPASSIAAAIISGPADAQVAAKYGHLDHSVLLSASAKTAPNPAPAAVASYETQVQ